MQKWNEGIFLRIKDESERAVIGTPHGIVFARCVRRVPKDDSEDGMLVNRIQGLPWDLQPGNERERVHRVQLDVKAAIPEMQAPPPTTGEQLSRRVYIRRAVELAKYGYSAKCVGCQHAKLGLMPADHSEECRARIVRHMTADEDLNQRVQVARQRMVESAREAPPEAQVRERDPSVSEQPQKKLRIAERADEQTPDNIVSSSIPLPNTIRTFPQTHKRSSIPVATSMSVDESE